MVNVGDVIKSLFTKMNLDIFVLIRIECLVALVTLLFLVMFIMDIYLCQSRDSTLSTILMAVSNGSDQIVIYLIGAMLSADFKNQLFPVWAIVLVGLQGSIGYLSGSNIRDRDWRIAEVANVMKFTVAGILNDSYGLQFTRPLWSLWAILTLRSMYRYWALGRSVNSLWLGRSSEFLPEYLRMSTSNHQGQGNNLDNDQMYLVYGETNQKIRMMKPRYVLNLDVTNPDSLITLGKIWKCSKPLLSSSGSHKYKDMSLAFVLSRLLRCRLEDVPLQSESITRIRYLIISEIIGDRHAESEAEAAQAARAFRILELELAFVRDYFYSLYPMVFWQGLLSLSLSLLQSITTFAVSFWLAVSIRKVNKLPKEDNFVLQVGQCNVDVIITWVFMIFMMFKEVWEMVTYLLSNWTGLLLVCKYVQNQFWCINRTCFIEDLISSLFVSKIVDPWHGRIDQYEFLQSCTYKPTLWKAASTLTLGIVPQKFDGRKTGDSIKIPECVKIAVLQELRHLDLKGHQLPKDSLNRYEQYEWTWLHTCSQAILVWHIATSLCEIKLAEANRVDLSKRGCLRCIWSCLKNLVCCSSHPFLVDDNSLQGQIQTNYRIANSLSRYCAYLVVFRCELLPDSFIIPDSVFEKTMRYASRKLKDCDSKRSRYDTLKEIAQEQAQDSEDGRLSMNIVQQGTMLAEDLINKDEEERWEILAGVWAKLLVHIAPSWNAKAHEDNLESGGEFITLIWALLWHCGIEKSSLWHGDKVYESSAHAPQGNSTEITQFIDEQDSKDRFEIREKPETSNFRKEKQSINTQIDMKEQAQMESAGRNTVD